MPPYHPFSFLFLPLMGAALSFLSLGECFAPPVSYLIDCGSIGNSSVDGRQWQSDGPDSAFVSTNHHILALRVANDTLPPMLPEGELLRTARIFTEESSYTFLQIPKQSRLWLRLYFYPFGFEGFDPWKARFSVIVNGQLLLSINTSIAAEISPSSSSLSSSFHDVYREYSIRMGTSLSELEVIFRPEVGAGFYALINAMEVVSMPDGAIADSAVPLGGGAGAVSVGFIEKETATVLAECIYRVNVGGPLITGANDTLGRMWEANDTGLISAAGSLPIAGDPSGIRYTQLAPRYIAPPNVLSTAIAMSLPPGIVADPIYNLTWVFPAPSSFPYLIRLLFCELVYSSSGQRVFDVFVQNQSVFNGFDIIEQASASDTIFFHDIYLNSSDSTAIWVQIGSSPTNTGADNRQGILNGVEIWKLSNLNLDATKKPVMRASVWAIFGIAMSALAAITALLLLVFCFFYHHQPKTKPNLTKLMNPTKTTATSIEKKAAASTRGIGGWFGSPLVGSYGVSASVGSKVSTAGGSYVSSAAPQPPNSLGRCFTLAEIREATNNFDESLLLGVGGFGKVYKGEMDDGSIEVAVKRGNPRSEQGMTEFLTEIEMLSKLRHRHLVSLIGYCEEQQEMILVYEYMANGPLRAHLYGCSTDSALLSWKKRLEICIGAARGLHYLHTGGAAQGIIHRDVKTTNILLDDNFVAKVSDFGLSKTGPALDRTHVSTAVKGSFGYLDPEYFRRQQLTEKSDVYSFGVVLLEVLCARPAINPALPRDQVNIAEWAMMWQKRGRLNEIVDPRLMPGTIHPESLKKFGETAEKCLADQGVDRPTMGDVLWNLEYTLQLQETATAVRKMEEECVSKTSSVELPIRILITEEEGHSAALENLASVSHSNTFLSSPSNNEECDANELSTSQVFSQLIKPQGR